MGGIFLLAVLVGGVIWWLASRQSVNRNERTYLRSRGYQDGDPPPPTAAVPAEARMLDLLASLDDVTPYARERAAEELSLMCESGARDERMFAPLATALDDRNAAVRGAVAVALGNLADVRAIDALKRVAENDESIHARTQARRALESIESNAKVTDQIEAAPDRDQH
ncbi:MAG: HEAT repeat domain-containing protein [Blastocatellia bacterium]